MNIKVRDLIPEDMPTLLALNETAVPHVNSIAMDTLRWFAAEAAYFRVACVDDDVGGFLIGLTPGIPYDSINFRWFCRRYDGFVYIDRIAVAEHHRRRGIANLLYEDIEAFASSRAPMLACEVNTRPRNEASLRFHQRRGFRAVGSQDTEAGIKTVTLLVKSLECSN